MIKVSKLSLVGLLIFDYVLINIKVHRESTCMEYNVHNRGLQEKHKEPFKTVDTAGFCKVHTN